tara:strand:+ start:397 stop:834 length:438 start_codon:yes stop_codon:yes gene_type:complete
MANTTNQGWTKPTVGGSEDTWGATINTALDSIDTLVGSVTAAEIAKLDGLTASQAELNYVTGITSAIQTQINTKAPIASPTFTGTATIPTVDATTANVTTVDLGDWTITQTGDDLIFSHSGTARFKLTSAGALTVEGDVTAFGDA